MADSVKSQPKLGAGGRVRPVRPLRLTLALLVGTLAFSSSIDSNAQSLLLGPAARRIKAKIELDPRLPTGSLRSSPSSQASFGERACSPTLPVCVASPGASTKVAAPSDQRMAEALLALETAYRHIVYAARLPFPIARSEGLGGSIAITWVLRADQTPLEVHLRAHHLTPFEAASVVCLSGADHGTVQGVERDAFLCVAEAVAARLDAAESARSRRAYAEALWWEIGRPTLVDVSAIARANAEPYRASVGRDEVHEATSTALFFEYLERTLGTEVPFGLVTGLFALSGQLRRSETPRYQNEPDWLDVLRATLGDDHSELSHRINAYAAARAQLGKPVGPLANLAFMGEFGRIRPDWELRVSTLPRRVASSRPLLPLGMLAIRVDIDVPSSELALAVKVEWESPAAFSWTVAKFDEADQELGRLDLAFEYGASSAEKRLVSLDGVRSLLILGTNLGGIDATHLLDPDHAPFEPHGCTVYVVRL